MTTHSLPRPIGGARRAVPRRANSAGAAPSVRRCALVACALAGTALVAGCGDGVTSPASAARLDASVQSSGVPASVRWNAIARDLVMSHRTSPPPASRVYALLSAAQYDAVTTANNGPGLGSERVAVASASASILTYLYADRAAALASALEDDVAAAVGEGATQGDVAAGTAHGSDAATELIRRAESDGAAAVWTGTVPTGPCTWFSATATAPLLPRWGEVRPWFMTSGSQFRAPPPPACGPGDFETALGEVQSISAARSAEQDSIARFWADGSGTYTPPGHWNAIAADLIARYALNERAAAYTLALMNMAVMDAGIAVWDTKYAYWFPRPSNVDPVITLPIGLPNFPSYPSGHSGFSAAASEVLAELFPIEAAQLRAMADQAGMSRVYGGIHYRFDSEAGLAQGRAVAALAISLFPDGTKVASLK